MADRFILQAPEGRAALVRGMRQMTRLLALTLGPQGRTVVIAPIVGSRPPEVLDSASIIARRTLGVGDHFEDIGAMIVRHLAWRMFERVGDGAATAAVLTQSLVDQASTYLAAGGNPVPLKRGIERGLDAALAELTKQARPIEEPEEIAALVAGIVRDPVLTRAIGTLVDSVGPDGSIRLEDAPGVDTTWEYIDGVRWSEGYLSPFLLKPGETTVRLLNPRIFVTDYHLEQPEQIAPALEACAAAGERNLLILAPAMADSVIGTLVTNREKGLFDGLMAAKAPLFGEQRSQVLQDIAAQTGGRCIQTERFDSLSEVTIDDLGRARQAWVTSSHFGIHGPNGDRGAIRDRIAEAKRESGTIDDDDWTRDTIRERIGKLAGLAAIIRVGGATASEQAERKLRLEAAVASARVAVQDGVVPGGGAALLACVPAVEALALDGDEAVGATILARALAEPMRTIARNAGLEPGTIVHHARTRGPGWAFDVAAGEWVDTRDARLLDPLAVVRAALETSVSAAGVTLSSDVLIHRREPPLSVQP